MIKMESDKIISNNDPAAISFVPKNNICDFQYVTEMMGFKKTLIKEMMDAFLKQVPVELSRLNEAISKKDYAVIASVAHSMKSSVSIMGITLLAPILQEIQDLGKADSGIDKISELNQKLNVICVQAIEEIGKEKANYV